MKIEVTLRELEWMRGMCLRHAWQHDGAETLQPKVEEAIARAREAEQLRARLKELES